MRQIRCADIARHLAGLGAFYGGPTQARITRYLSHALWDAVKEAPIAKHQTPQTMEPAQRGIAPMKCGHT
ncbi:hypothetical protein [Cupriavidus sp. UYPR2.512]|uniref:hypothetical protein n=1 Tax=Cupriavidus sp. UYPR2.512 TaxID=1080187 RepID=UPI0003A60D98|nr:hypothetical protein [Cupriavidus sp. UYPR2.512]